MTLSCIVNVNDLYLVPLGLTVVVSYIRFLIYFVCHNKIGIAVGGSKIHIFETLFQTLVLGRDRI